jgi:hypothetical protein
VGAHARTGTRGIEDPIMINVHAADAARDLTFDIVGQYEAFIVMTHVDAKTAAATLPSELELAPPAGTPMGMHPVMYSFGKHRHVHPDALKVLEYDYDESLVGLPHVAVRGAGGALQACFHMVDVRLNNKIAKQLGDLLGFPKHMATIGNHDTSYRIHARTVPLLSVKMRLDGRKFKDDHRHFGLIARMMQQPVVSRSKIGRIIITEFTIDTANAFMVPARMTLEVTTDELACLPRGTHVFGTIDEKEFGGAYMSVHDWRIAQRPLVVL